MHTAHSMHSTCKQGLTLKGAKGSHAMHTACTTHCTHNTHSTRKQGEKLTDLQEFPSNADIKYDTQHTACTAHPSRGRS